MSAIAGPSLRRDLGLVAWQVRYEQRAFWRNRGRGIFTFAFPLMFLVIFASLFKGQHVSERGGIPYNDFFMPGILAYGLIATTYVNMAIGTAILRDEGVLKRMQGTPLPRWAYATGRVLSTVLTVVAMTAITLGLGVAAYGVHVRSATIPAVLLSLLLGTAAFTALGIGIVRFIIRTLVIWVAAGSLMMVRFLRRPQGEAELAGRLPPDRAGDATHEIAELEGALMALWTAGITADVDWPAVKLAPAVEAVLAWTVREGATNVIRHSGASRCSLKITAGVAEAGIEVVDDGQGRDWGAASVGLGRAAASGVAGCAVGRRATTASPWAAVPGPRALQLEPDIEVVAEVARGDEVTAAALARTPDVALLDIGIPGSTGLYAADELRAALPA
jgi:ABC-type transport system involved in cytochrome c biogenesis permease component